MPALSPKKLVEANLQAIEDSGYSGLFVSSKIREHPRKFTVAMRDADYLLLWVYIWTLTPGGRPSLPNEYRIQMTSVSSPLAMNPLGPTLLLGYEPDLGVFTGFDLQRHGSFTEGSPSVQIDIQTCRQALQDGFAFDRKSNQEIAVAFRPDQLVNYAQSASELHRLGKQSATLDLLKRATALEDISDADLAPLRTEKRQQLVQTVRRLSRSANFRQQVMHAYGNRCAVTRIQLRLVDAAHILPVGAPGSADDVRNGLSLSPTYHRAYDNGLIYLDDQMVMRLNGERRDELASLQLVGGIDTFCEPLGPIHLPPDRHQHPNKSMICKANRFRRIPATD